MKDLRRIFVPTDFSEASARVLDRAVALALRTGASLRVFHADLLHEHDPARFEEATRTLLARAEQQRARIAGDSKALEIDVQSARDVSAYPAIMNAIAEFEPDLVMMSTHGGGLLSGSLAEHVVGHAPCNVLVMRKDARGSWPEQEGPIVVPVDFSDNSRRALAVAQGLTDDPASLVVVHIVADPDRPAQYAEDVPSPFELDPKLRKSVEERLADWADGPVGEFVVAQGEVERGLLRQADEREAALIVIGTRGLHTFPERLLGGTAQHLTRRSATPVLTVP